MRRYNVGDRVCEWPACCLRTGSVVEVLWEDNESQTVVVMWDDETESEEEAERLSGGPAPRELCDLPTPKVSAVPGQSSGQVSADRTVPGHSTTKNR